MKSVLLYALDFLKKNYSQLSIRKKIILLYFFLILFPAIMMIFFFYQKSSLTIEKEVSRTIFEALKQMEINISYKLDNAKKVSNIVFSDPGLQEYLDYKDKGSIYDHIKNTEKLKNIIEITKTRGEVYKVRLFLENKNIQPFDSDKLYDIGIIKKKDWYEKIVGNKGAVFWKSTYQEKFEDGQSEYVISCARMLTSLSTGKSVSGVLMVDILENDVFSAISEVKFAKNQNIVVIDADGNIISNSEKSKAGNSIRDSKVWGLIGGMPEGVYVEGNGRNKDYIIYKSIRMTGWRIVALIPAKDMKLENTATETMSATLVIILTLIIFMLVLVFLLSLLIEGVTKRIRSITKNMENAGIEGYVENIPPADIDIKRLENSVNSMIGTIKSLVEESFQAKLNERDARMKALQAQINPHFLYNTLDTINWMAIRKNASDISYMIESLAKYFRLSLNKGRDIVKVEDELELARVYLTIQNERFSGSIHFKFDIDDAINQYSIPNFILQPLIENAILHGIQKKLKREGNIIISAKVEKDSLVFTIEDDGVGMSGEKMQNFFSSPSGDNSSGGYGIYNVNERIKLFSGEKSGISVTSVEGKGTKIQIQVKATKL